MSSMHGLSNHWTAKTILRAVESTPVVVTVEESALAGGFGSAVLEAATDAGLETGRIRRLGIPDRFVEHGERGELLADLALDVDGIAEAVRAQASRAHLVGPSSRRRVS